MCKQIIIVFQEPVNLLVRFPAYLPFHLSTHRRQTHPNSIQMRLVQRTVLRHRLPEIPCQPYTHEQRYPFHRVIVFQILIILL